MLVSPSPYDTRSFTRDKLSWLITLLLAAGLISYGIYWHLNPVEHPPPPISTVSDNPHILVLAYGQVVRKPDNSHVHKTQLREHLTALSEQGYEPISVQALHDFYFAQQKLPRKPVLLTFDNGFLETYKAAHKVLVETGWRAAIALTTIKQQSKNTHYLYWDRLARMLNSGYWEVLSQGHRASEEIPINNNGETGLFAANTLWRSDLNRQESFDEFATRIENDIKSSRDLIYQKLQTRALGYVFPFGSPSQIYNLPDMQAAEQQVRQNILALGFIDDFFGVNDRRSKPYALNRLRVDHTWEAQALMYRINAAIEFPTTGKIIDQDSVHWLTSEGKMHIQSDEIKISGTPRAITWLGGSQWENNWILKTKMKLSAGDVWFFQRDHGLNTEWRIGGNESGLSLRQLHHNTTVHTQHAATVLSKGQWHELIVTKRGNGVWAALDGIALWEQPVRLQEAVLGSAGWLTWSEQGNSELTLTNTSLTALRPATEVVSNIPTAEEVARITRQPHSISALAPHQFVLDALELQELTVDTDLIRLLCHRYAWQHIPTVVFSPTFASTPQALAYLKDLTSRTDSNNWDGLHFDVSRLSRQSRLLINETFSNIADRLARENRYLMVTVKPGDKPEPWRAEHE